MRRPADLSRVAGVLAVLVTLTGACSVTTPRREAGFVRSTGTGGAVGQDGTSALDGTGELLEPGQTAAGGGGGGAGQTAAGARGAAAGGAGGAAGRSAAQAAALSGPAVTGVTKDAVSVSVIAGFSGP